MFLSTVPAKDMGLGMIGSAWLLRPVFGSKLTLRAGVGVSLIDAMWIEMGEESIHKENKGTLTRKRANVVKAEVETFWRYLW